MYKFMSNEEIEINQMNRLKMVHLYKLGDNDALAVYYGEDKQINLCSMDAYYNVLVCKVLSLYSQCDDTEAIIMDDATRKVFEHALPKEIQHTPIYQKFGEKYMNQEGSLSPSFASDGVIRETLLPLLKYYMTQLYHMWQMNAEFETEAYGWRRNCVLKVKKEEDTVLLPLRMDFMVGNNCRVIIQNFLKDLCQIIFEISYRENELFIRFESKDFNLLGESHFAINKEKVNAYTTIRVDGQVVFHQDEPLELISLSEDNHLLSSDIKAALTDTEISPEQWKIYKLPWNSLILYLYQEIPKDTIHRTTFDIIYIEAYHNKLALRRLSHCLVENKTDGLKLRTDGFALRSLYYGTERKEVETFFLPVGYYSGWDYKKLLENKYFYHELEVVR